LIDSKAGLPKLVKKVILELLKILHMCVLPNSSIAKGQYSSPNENPNQSYQQNDYEAYPDLTKKANRNGANCQLGRSITNSEALSPSKRSSTLGNKYSAASGYNNHSFASNFRKTQNALEDNYSDVPMSQRRGLSNTGSKIMRYKQDDFSLHSQTMNSSHSVSPSPKPL